MLKDLKNNQTILHEDQKLDNENSPLLFSARLMAYYRAKENKTDFPIITDPFAEHLAGDIISYFDNHVRYSEMDYPIVRSFYIEETLLKTWCNAHKNSQIVLLGAGLDARAYRLKCLQTKEHNIFEIDLPIVIRYKEKILKREVPLCNLVRIPADLSNLQWISFLIRSGFSSEMPTFWILEGLVYYIERESVVSLLAKTSEISSKNSQIFVDICIPILAEIKMGPFSKYFKWGLDKKDIPSFFSNLGWNVSCSYADDYDQGRDVGQKGLIFVCGEKAIIK